jgi:hypothetical protein
MTVRRPPTRVGGALSSVGLVGCLLLVGCTGGGTDDDAAPTSTATTSTTATQTSAAAPVYQLPDSCSGLLTLRQIDAALATPLPGQTTFLVGEPQPGIGRTGRISCGFGVSPATDTAAASDPLLEVSVFTYTDAGAAEDRVQDTLEGQAAQGVRSETVELPAGEGTPGGEPAVVLTSPVDATLIVGVDARVYSLTLVAGIVDEPATATAMGRLAADVLANDGRRQAGLTPAATSSPRSTAPAGTTSAPGT